MKKILVVDDAQTVLQYQKLLLSGQDFEITTASNGIEALKKIEEDPPDLILMDLIMPEMDGLTCCRLVKTTPKTKRIPIILVTTVTDREKIEDFKRVGCDDFVFKPVKKVELLLKIKKALN
ncbi:response regulator [bacterium]|nr:response regulator [bacterium]